MPPDMVRERYILDIRVLCEIEVMLWENMFKSANVAVQRGHSREQDGANEEGDDYYYANTKAAEMKNSAKKLVTRKPRGPDGAWSMFAVC